jgi:hypothetical protein
MICYNTPPFGDNTFTSSYHHKKQKIMKTKTNIILLAVMLLFSYSSMAQKATTTSSKTENSTEMKTYVIEREIPGAGKLTAQELKSISQASCGILKNMGPQIQWVHSYVAGNKIYCIYKAENEDLIKEHAKKGGFPANSITPVSSVISPATAN